MEQFDREKARRVWQRVQGTAAPPPPEPGEDLRELVARETESAAVYLQLSRQFQGKDSAALRQMSEQEQSHAAILKGICALNTGTRPGISVPHPENGPAEVVLRRCYGREMQSLAEYERRSGDPQYGAVFRKIAEQEQAHCRTVLELLGRLEQKKPPQRHDSRGRK